MLRRLSLVMAGLALVALFVSNLQNFRPLAAPELDNAGAATGDERLAPIARRYAPFIYQATDARRGRQDLVSNVDFDGDLIGNNNWENFDRFRLKPTVYYAVLETETHYFIAYHLYHPRDWNNFTVWLNDTHENDGENLQVVVRKRDARVVLLWTQAHYKSWVYTDEASGIAGGALPIEAPLLRVDSEGRPGDGAHAAVFVEAEGHGIYGAKDSSSGVAIESDGSYKFAGGSGILLRPAEAGETIGEPRAFNTGQVAYQLDSITLKLWPLLRDGQLTGDGKLLDGSWAYRDDLVEIEQVPRFYDGDRTSGPLGPDRGISPFALDFTFERGSLGALFFNPAKRYADKLKITDDWSRQYVAYPFGN